MRNTTQKQKLFKHTKYTDKKSKKPVNLSLASCVGMRRSTCAASSELRAKLSVLPAREADRVTVDLVLMNTITTQTDFQHNETYQTKNTIE